MLNIPIGGGFGLHLVLNVEQYEYTKGPNSDAGVKVVLHSQNDISRNRELGFTVSPGFHSLVSVKYTKVCNTGHGYQLFTQTYHHRFTKLSFVIYKQFKPLFMVHIRKPPLNIYDNLISKHNKFVINTSYFEISFSTTSPLKCFDKYLQLLLFVYGYYFLDKAAGLYMQALS